MSRHVKYVFLVKKNLNTQNTIWGFKTQYSHFSSGGHSGRFHLGLLETSGWFLTPTPPHAVSAGDAGMWSGGALGERHTSAGQLPPTRDHRPQGPETGAKRLPGHTLTPGFPLKRHLPLTLLWRAPSHLQVVSKLPLKTVTSAALVAGRWALRFPVLQPLGSWAGRSEVTQRPFMAKNGWDCPKPTALGRRWSET